MKYFLAKLGFVMLLSALIGSFLRVDMLFVFGGVFILFGILTAVIFKHFNDFAALFLAAALGFVLVGVNLVTEFYPAKSLEGASAEITGVVTKISSGGGNPVYTLKTESIDIEGAPQNITLKLSSWQDFNAKEYDKISCTAVFNTFGDGSINEILENRSRGIAIYAYAETPMEIIGRDNSSFGYFVHLIREKISSVIYEYFIDRHAAFMDKLLIDGESDLDYSVTNSFKRSGMSHILAISGTHMVIIIGTLEKLLYRFDKKHGKKFFIAVLALATLFYMLISGLGFSVLRAGIMLIVRYAAKLLFCGSKSLDNLGAAIVFVLLLDPLAACDIGFLLSVTACFAISVFAPKLVGLIEKKGCKNPHSIKHILTENFVANIAASLAVIPVSVFVFGEFSLISPIANIFAALFAQYALIFGVLTAVFGLLPFCGFIAGGFAFIAMLCTGALLKIAEIASSLPFAYIDAARLWVAVLIAAVTVLIIAPIVYSKSFKYLKHSVLIGTVLVLSAVLLRYIFFSGVVSIEVKALEHGTAITCSKDGKSVLVTHGLSAADSYAFGGGTYDIISIEPQSGSSEIALLERAKPDFALVYFDESAEIFENAEKFTPGKTEIFDGGYIEFLSGGVFCIETGEATLLYISKECDIMDIKPKFRRADIIVLDGVTPELFPEIRSEYLIFRSKSGYFNGSTEIITLKSGEINFFAYNKNIKKGWGAN